MDTDKLIPIERTIQRRLKLAGGLVIAALGIEVISLFWNRPIAFLVFMFGGGLLLTAGILIYLHSLVSWPKIHSKKP